MYDHITTIDIPIRLTVNTTATRHTPKVNNCRVWGSSLPAAATKEGRGGVNKQHWPEADINPERRVDTVSVVCFSCGVRIDIIVDFADRCRSPVAEEAANANIP